MRFIQSGRDGQNAVIDARQPEPKNVILKRCVEKNKLQRRLTAIYKEPAVNPGTDKVNSR